MKKLIIGVMNN